MENKNINDTNWISWNPKSELKEVSSKEIIYSKGFLRSDPVKLCPSFSSFWNTFIENYFLDIEFIDIKKELDIPENLKYTYKGNVDNENIFIGYKEEAFAYLGNLIIPEGNDKMMGIAMDYLTRRFLASLSFSWSASETSVIYFDGKIKKDNVEGEAVIDISLKVSGTRVNIYIICPYSIVNTIDKLWKGQVQASSKYRDISEIALDIEIAELAVSPTMLNDYLSSGVRVGLEKIVNNSVVIKKNHEPFFKGKLLRSGDRFVVKILGLVDSYQTPPAGMISISIELGSVTIPGYVLSELSQKDVLWDTGIEISNKVNIYADHKYSAKALLAEYDKQFAIEVI